MATTGDRVTAIGEAKWRGLGVDDLERLRHIRDITPRAGRARLLLVSAAGADRPLQALARQNADVELVDLERLYCGT